MNIWSPLIPECDYSYVAFPKLTWLVHFFEEGPVTFLRYPHLGKCQASPIVSHIDPVYYGLDEASP